MEKIAIGQEDFRFEKAGMTVEKKTLRQGRSRGVEVVEIQKGDASVSFLPTRASAVRQAVFDGIPLFWQSPVRPVHPAFINLLRNEGLGWLDGFCEGMARCGLEHFGNPVEETIMNNQGQSIPVFRPLHGEIGQIPAEEVSVEIEGADGLFFKSILSFESVFGSKYMVENTTELNFSDRSMAITDRVMNRSRERDLPVKLCYHINFGAPVLDESAELLMPPPREIVPLSPRAEAGLEAYGRFGPPQKMFVEQCFLMNEFRDREVVTALLLNRKIRAAVTLSFASRDFPCLIEWKQLGLDEYVLGLEPATCAPPSLWKGQAPRDLPVLAPGSHRSFSFQIRLLTDSGEIEQKVKDLKGEA